MLSSATVNSPDRRPLGRTGRFVNPLGFGTWGLPGSWWKGVDARDAKAALQRGLDRGINFVDTALVYGDGVAEQWIGQALLEMRLRDDVLVASKVPPANGQWPARAGVPLAAAFAPEYIMRSVEASLRNLRAEAVGLMQFHVWHDQWLDDPLWPAVRGTLERCVREGKVLHWGISANDKGANDCVRVVAEPVIESVQVIYNIFERGPEAKLFAAAATHQAAVIVRCPLDEGALGGDVGADTTFQPGDWRNRYFRAPRLNELTTKLAALAALVEAPPRGATMNGTQPARPDRPEARTLAELALRFAIAPAVVSAVIPGMRQVQHVDANLRVLATPPLSEDLMRRLDAHAWDKNWYE